MFSLADLLKRCQKKEQLVYYLAKHKIFSTAKPEDFLLPVNFSYKLFDREAEREPDREAEREPDREAEREPDREAERGPDREAERGPDREAERGPDREEEKCPLILFIFQENLNLEIQKEAIEKWREVADLKTVERLLKYALANTGKGNTYYKSPVWGISKIVENVGPPEDTEIYREIRKNESGDLGKNLYNLYFFENTVNLEREKKMIISPLEYACLHKKANLVRKMLKLGVDPNYYKIRPAVTISVVYCKSIFFPLVRAGANISDEIFSPYHTISPIEMILRDSSPLHVIKELVLRGAGLKGAYKWSIWTKREDFFLYLFDEIALPFTPEDLTSILIFSRFEFDDVLDNQASWVYRNIKDRGYHNIVPFLLLTKVRLLPPRRVFFLSKNGAESLYSRMKSYQLYLKLILTDFYYKPGGPGALLTRIYEK